MQDNLDWSQSGVTALITRLGVRDLISPDERDVLRAAAGKTMHFPAGEQMVIQHSSPQFSLLMASGIAARFNLVSDGGRQITAFHILGDFVDLHGLLLSRMDHGVIALTDTVAIAFPHDELREITARYPHLTRLLWLSTLLDGAIHRQWLVAMGRMPALSHVAHLFCEHFVRARAVGLGTEDSFPFPITQAQMADAVGLSIVHLNRVVQELRNRFLLQWEGGIVTLLDWRSLQRLGQFDNTYLDLEREPR